MPELSLRKTLPTVKLHPFSPHRFLYLSTLSTHIQLSSVNASSICYQVPDNGLQVTPPRKGRTSNGAVGITWSSKDSQGHTMYAARSSPRLLGACTDGWKALGWEVPTKESTHSSVTAMLKVVHNYNHPDRMVH